MGRSKAPSKDLYRCNKKSHTSRSRQRSPSAPARKSIRHKPSTKQTEKDRLNKLLSDKSALKKLEKALRKTNSDKNKLLENLTLHAKKQLGSKSKRKKAAICKSANSAPSSSKGSTPCKDSAPSGSGQPLKKRKRSRSSTRFTHVKKSKSKIQNDEPACSTLKVSKSRLKVDLDDHSASMLRALETPEHLAHVEVCAKASSTASVREIKTRVRTMLKQRQAGDRTIPFQTDSYLKSNIQRVIILPPLNELLKGTLANTRYQVHVYQLNDNGAATDDWEEEDMNTARHWVLPNKEFEGVWENLIFTGPVKEKLLNYASMMLAYSDRQINTNVISCNRIVLLHGPPGTGKTSLCKALAQQLCIRMSHKYRQGQLVEINSHGLFSKWFSESGKLVAKMFQKVQDFANQKDTLVCILIDEVESLAAARKHMMNGNEPSDSVRVVNALLTQLDAIKRYPNVIILTTSNVTGALELAFVDRADIKEYIPKPNAEAIYSIYRDCIHELISKDIIHPAMSLLPRDKIDKKKVSSDSIHKHSEKLWSLAKASIGLSGRSLRKIPFLAHASHALTTKIDINKFWDALHKCIENQHQEGHDLSKDPEL